MKRYEISLWDNCSNGCSFCWTFNSPRSNKISLEKQNLAVQKAKLIIDGVKPEDDVLITGGEIFDVKDEQLCKELAQLFDKLIISVIFKKIHHLFIITNFVNSNQRLIDYFYRLLKPLTRSQLERIHITTSYDVIGRFHSEGSKQEFFSHLKLFAEILPKRNITVNTIMTKSACEAVLNDWLDIVRLQEENCCSWELIPFVSNIENEIPTKRMVFDTLKKIEYQCPGFINKFIPDYNGDTTSVYLKLNGDQVKDSTVDKLPCGHSINFNKYASDSESCFMCDVDEYFNISGKHNGYLSIELWPDCTVNCPFCFNKDRKLRPTSRDKKIDCIQRVIDYLKTDFFKYKTIQIMGGEFFNGEIDDPEVFDKFIDMCKFLNELAVKHYKQICIYTALKKTSGLYESMDVLTANTEPNMIKFNTSFNYGITHTETNTQQFIDEVLKVRERYPQIKMHVQSLLSDQIINMPFNQVLNIYSPFLKNNIEIDFHPVTIIGVNTWTERSGKKFREILASNPITKNIAIKNRDKALEFCTNLYYNFGPDCFTNFRVNTTRAETKWLVVEDIWEKDIAVSDLHCDNNKCGHTYHMANAYLDSDECLSCDINRLMEAME